MKPCEHCGVFGNRHQANCLALIARESDTIPGKFGAVHCSVTQAGRTVARAISKTMAKRIANALNSYRPNREGV